MIQKKKSERIFSLFFLRDLPKWKHNYSKVWSNAIFLFFSIFARKLVFWFFLILFVSGPSVPWIIFSRNQVLCSILSLIFPPTSLKIRLLNFKKKFFLVPFFRRIHSIQKSFERGSLKFLLHHPNQKKESDIKKEADPLFCSFFFLHFLFILQFLHFQDFAYLWCLLIFVDFPFFSEF